jgi:ectoine hydroxylase-related dioxygenase (phytanoyl-CoA dioxygenase family)
MAQAQADLDEYGLTRVAGAASAQQLAQAKQRLMEQAAGELAAGVAHCDAGANAYPTAGAANQRVWNLFNKGQVFRDLVLNSVVLALMKSLLGEELLLFSVSANIARRGGEPQPLHGDQQHFLPENITRPLIANSLWMLDEFTDENGATRVVPGSHQFLRSPRQGERIETIPAVGPAGTLLVWDGRLWHGTGANRTAVSRHGLLIPFCQPCVRTQENHTVGVSPEVLEKCPAELLSMLGFAPWRSLGMVDGRINELRRGLPTRRCGELTADGRSQI